MILRRFQRFSSMYQGTSLLHNSRIKSHLIDISSAHITRCTLPIKSTNECLHVNAPTLPNCIGNTTKEYHFSKVQNDSLGRSVSYRNNALLAKPKLLWPNSLVTLNNVRHYSSSSEAVTAVTATTSPTSPTYIGYFKTVSESVPVEYIQKALIFVHSQTGLPWWATIVLGAIALRATISFPLSIYQHHLGARLELVKTDMDGIMHKLQNEARFGVNNLHWNPALAKSFYARSVKKEWQKRIVEQNCHPMKTLLLGVIQIPVYVCCTFALLNSCYMLPIQNDFTYNVYRELAAGGFGWISNLTTNDPYFIIPVISGITALTSIELRLLLRDRNSKLVKFATYAYRICIPGIILLTLHLPSGVYLFWLISNFYTLFESLVMLSPKLRRFTGIPVTESEQEHPYLMLREKVQDRLGFKRSLKIPTKV